MRLTHGSLSRLPLLLILLGGATLPVAAQTSAAAGSGPLPQIRTAADVYRAACVTCHGPDGKGSPAAIVGFATPLPDFTDCAFATAEPDPDWHAVVSEGGPIRGLDRHMPAFGDALSADDIALAINHLRTFCTDRRWPRGDLNLPRAFFTEKAFPENEALWTMTLNATGTGAIVNDAIYERRFGARAQVEVKLPLAFADRADGWGGGVGDVAVAFKQVLHANVARGSIGSAGLEIILPTGNESRGWGGGDTVLEPFFAWGQILPRNTFMQLHTGAELPVGSAAGESEVFIRAAYGGTIAAQRGFGRAWSPQVELLWARPEGGGAEWDIVPQMQVTLSKLQHVSVAGGVRIPLTQRRDRSTQALVYLLWDWFDGGFLEFWK